MNNSLKWLSFSKDELVTVLNKFPTLNIHGFCHEPRSGNDVDSPYHPENHKKEREKFFEERYLLQIQTVLKFCNFNTIPKHFTSYTLKHAAENWGEEFRYEDYVTNGCAVVGAVLAGYTVRRERNSPNCKFR